MKKIFSVVTIALLVAVDQLIKIVIDLWLKPIHRFILADGFLSLTYVENRGAAFGILQNKRSFFIVITGIILIAGLYLLLSDKIRSNYILISVILVLSGGFGNMVDRIFRMYVIDYIEPLFIHFAVFNFADILVCIGAFMLIAWSIIDAVKTEKKEKKEKQLAAESEQTK